MTTTYEVLADVLCPFSKLVHRGTAAERPGHKLVLDDSAKTLGFLDGRTVLGVSGKVTFNDADMASAKKWLADQVATKTLAVVIPTSPAGSAKPAAQPEPATPSPAPKPPEPEDKQ